MKQSQTANEQCRVLIKHVAGYPDQGRAKKVGGEIDDPHDRGNRDAQCSHAHRQGLLRPHADQGQEQGHVAEVKEIRRPVQVAVDGGENRHVGSEQDVDRPRDLSIRHLTHTLKLTIRIV